MREFFGNLRHFLSARLWAWPILTAAVGIVASLVLHDVRISGDVPWARFLWPGDASAASDMLSFISSTTLTVLTTTISMTLIVLQVASGNFSHQLLRDFIESRAVRGILAVYVGVVAYSLTLQRSIDADSEFVPQLAMTVSMILIAVSLATFIWYVSRVVDMVRVDAIIDGTVRQTLANIDERIDAADCGREPRPVVPAGAQLLTSNDHGFVQGVDIAAAERWARKFNAVVVIDARPGDLIVQGQTWGRWWPADGGGHIGGAAAVAAPRCGAGVRGRFHVGHPAGARYRCPLVGFGRQRHDGGHARHRPVGHGDPADGADAGAADRPVPGRPGRRLGRLAHRGRGVARHHHRDPHVRGAFHRGGAAVAAAARYREGDRR
ncbi:MAG TPA: DUF2254 domain-containing protein [Actinomycetales bacterium]|nr:DUF2254 domain-containing protein [Actinomycetales bacterium]